jgi:hypothetical protein
MASLTVVAFETYSEAQASIGQALARGGYMELFGIPDAAEEYFPAGEEDFECQPYEGLAEDMTHALLRHGVITVTSGPMY